MGDFITKERYSFAIVFVDCCFKMGYVHLQKSTSTAQKLEDKEAYERFATQHGIRILHYYADNGTFAANEWVRACITPHEMFSTYGLFPNELERDPIMAFKASVDSDTMYLHQAMKEKDAPQFRKAMIKEVNAQIEGGVLTLVHRSEVPPGATVLPAVW